MNPFEARDRSSLISSMTGQDAPQFLFFWGHKTHSRGSMTKSCLSQWYPSPFEIDGKTYPTAEHFMMAEKARLFGDQNIEKQILTCTDPNEAKKLGRRVQDFDHPTWKRLRFNIVVKGNLSKFSQNQALNNFLKNTTGRILVEASPHDRIWGIGLAHDHPDAECPTKWPGLNLLGFALMEVRAALS